MFNLQAWAEFVCPHCGARLEAKAPPSTMLSILIPLVALLGHRGRIFEVVAVVFMVAVFVVFLKQASQPQLRCKKPLPKPGIRLNIAGTEQ
jgi:hypothetical protein